MEDLDAQFVKRMCTMEHVSFPEMMALLEMLVFYYHKDEELVSWKVVMEMQNIIRQMNCSWYQQLLEKKVYIIS